MDKKNETAPKGGETIIVQIPDNLTKLDVQIQEETVWLTQQQMALLFEKDRTVVVRHINNIYKEQKLAPESTCAFFAQVQMEGHRVPMTPLQTPGK